MRAEIKIINSQITQLTASTASQSLLIIRKTLVNRELLMAFLIIQIIRIFAFFTIGICLIILNTVAYATLNTYIRV